jgi:hypothetical protein
MPPMDTREEQVLLETERYRVEGKLTISKEGYRSRLSDHLNRRDQEFLVIKDARVVPLDGSSEGWATPVLMISRHSVRMVIPSSDET